MSGVWRAASSPSDGMDGCWRWCWVVSRADGLSYIQETEKRENRYSVLSVYLWPRYLGSQGTTKNHNAHQHHNVTDLSEKGKLAPLSVQLANPGQSFRRQRTYTLISLFLNKKKFWINEGEKIGNKGLSLSFHQGRAIPPPPPRDFTGIGTALKLEAEFHLQCVIWGKES